jgi:hypothetical protein
MMILLIIRLVTTVCRSLYDAVYATTDELTLSYEGWSQFEDGIQRLIGYISRYLFFLKY